jgi:hypothetical protein
MLRIILRNIQFYLLLSSGLLALVAFQHFYWYDQGILPYSQTALLDKPSYGSPDVDTRGVLYYGDESKQIGIFKFRVGLFKFALPTFAKDELSIWEGEGSRWKTVPVPPNRIRKGRDELLRRKKVEVRQKANKASIAYVVAISFHEHRSLRERAAVLAASIKKSHGKSSYDYKLHAINYEQPSSSETEKSYSCDHACREILNSLGYKVVNVSSSSLDAEMERRKNSLQNPTKDSLNELLSSSIVVHLGLDSFMLRSIDSIYYDLLQENKSGIEIQSDDTSRKWSSASLRAKTDRTTESLALEAKAEITDDQFYIFKPSSREATISYLGFLNCLSSTYLSNSNTVQPSKASNTNIERRDNWQPTLYPKIRSLLASAMPNTIVKENERDEGNCIMKTNNAVLDKCIYSAGSHKCTAVHLQKEAAVASFTGSVCLKPWECERNSNGDGCDDLGEMSSQKSDCAWLQNEWFRLAKSL